LKLHREIVGTAEPEILQKERQFILIKSISNHHERMDYSVRKLDTHWRKN
jgi:hypothetical protein